MRAAVVHDLGSAPRYGEFPEPVAREPFVLAGFLTPSGRPPLAGGASHRTVIVDQVQ